MLSPRSSSAGPLGWGWFASETPSSVAQDGVGNRLTQTAPEGTSTYSYQSGNNRLASVSGPNPKTFAYDANGNTILENSRTYTYSQNGRLIQAAEGSILGEYSYSAREQRVTKTTSGQTTVFHHGQSGQILAEAQASGVTMIEYLYLQGEALARAEGAIVKYVHLDHLGTPRSMTDASSGKVWEIEARPFGDAATINGAGSLNLRFPGQYFDQETGLNQNWHRDYVPWAGRYLQPDPIGLEGGDHRYVYARNDSVSVTDPVGLTAGSRKLPFGWPPPLPKTPPLPDRFPVPECCDGNKIREAMDEALWFLDGMEAGQEPRGTVEAYEIGEGFCLPPDYTNCRFNPGDPASFVPKFVEQISDPCVRHCVIVHEWTHYTDDRPYLRVWTRDANAFGIYIEYPAYFRELVCLRKFLQ